mmetsp:Transcript_21045/g.66497  ORF Transcript_21045/g.66497 Transcript_21045/m.66497 type:complete len:178 (-) Transcript_21045:65-598(-)
MRVLFREAGGDMPLLLTKAMGGFVLSMACVWSPSSAAAMVFHDIRRAVAATDGDNAQAAATGRPFGGETVAGTGEVATLRHAAAATGDGVGGGTKELAALRGGELPVARGGTKDPAALVAWPRASSGAGEPHLPAAGPATALGCVGARRCSGGGEATRPMGGCTAGLDGWAPDCCIW